MKELIKPVAVLTLICLVVAAGLAYLNTVTAPVIAAAEKEAAAKARTEVLQEAESFVKIEGVAFPEGVLEAYRGSDQSGYVFTVSEKGYGGELKLIVGIRPDGTIEAVRTLSHSETKGIGSLVVDNDSGYNKNYIGADALSYEQVPLRSGATISSKAYKQAVASAFEALQMVGGEQHE